MAEAVLFVCPECGLGRQLPLYVVERRLRCLDCEESFCSEGQLFTAADWAQHNEPHRLVSIVAGVGQKLSARKWRLWSCAIGRLAFDWCRNPWFRDALQLAERWADEEPACDVEWNASKQKNRKPAIPLKLKRGVRLCRTQLGRVELPAHLRERRTEDQYEGDEYLELPWYAYNDYLSREQRAFQRQQEREQFAWVPLAMRCLNEDPQFQLTDITQSNQSLAATLFRDLLSNPLIPLSWSPDWSTSTVRELATRIYTYHEFGAMPILADALQDAGCEDEQILNHCRTERIHARGCWVVDALLGTK